MTENEENVFKTQVERFYTRLGESVLQESCLLHAEYFHSKEPVRFENRLGKTFLPAVEGTVWGEAWDSAWFHLTGTVPASWKGKTVVAQLDFNGEGLLFSAEGVPVEAITNGSIFKGCYNKDVVELYPRCAGGEQVDLWVEAAANHLFGITVDKDPKRSDPQRFGNYEGKVNKIRLCVLDTETLHLWYDYCACLHFYRALPQKSVRRARMLQALREVADCFADLISNSRACRTILGRELSKPAAPSDLTTVAVGHAHIDTGWMWPVAESIRKCARTFANQIRMINKYPGYVFGASQPQHYAFVKEHYPKLYQKIKAAVKDGRWECQGGMWVEADCNIISGESMVRQFVHGKNFFMDEFGVDVKNLWLPDVFGYSAAMPQIIRRSGCDYFVTTKLSWSQYNQFPHSTFKWRGIDNSEVLTHLPPENSYISELFPNSLIQAQEYFPEKGYIDEFLTLFGIGDGGGGPKETHVEFGLRQQNCEGVPRVRFGKASELLEKLSTYRDRLPTWVGELYLEMHRGTLTSQALVKKQNRQLEQKLRVVEALWSCLPLATYPSDQLDAIWKKVLLNQFHDIIPGSSINKVYEVTHAEHAQALAECDALIARAASGLCTPDENSIVVFNPLSYEYTRSFELPASWSGCGVRTAHGEECVVQHETEKSVCTALVPPHSFVSLIKTERAANPSETTNGLVLENALVKYVFESTGAIVSAFDKEAGRDILNPGEKGNLFALYEDRPNVYDAWEVDIFYESQLLENARTVAACGLSSGSVRQGLSFTLSIGQSTINQKVSLEHNSKRLDFATAVDWAECHKMLRVSFATAVYAEQASYDIQYGFIRRPTHRNTTWDMAKFEVVGQRYADLSGNDYGVALLNNCKYGYKVLDRTIDLNLLRAPTFPDPDADLGHHEFTYSLLPHRGDLVHSTVMAEAAMLNLPLACFEGVAAHGIELPCVLDGAGLSLEVIKKAEHENCHIIRIVETLGCRSSGTLRVKNPAAKLVETNLIEWESGVGIECQNPFAITLNPFEIRTYKILSA